MRCKCARTFNRNLKQPSLFKQPSLRLLAAHRARVLRLVSPRTMRGGAARRKARGSRVAIRFAASATKLRPRNAFRRATSQASLRSLRLLWAILGLGAVLPGTGHLSSRLSPAFTRTRPAHEEQTPVVGSDSYPGPPGCAGIRPPHARRRRHPHSTARRLMKRPSRTGCKGIDRIVVNKLM